ncbi:hypothetical protein [Pseudoalteromonas luteoviolacea]|uniref:Flagellar protein FliT n=1 Tax=Pseudoalteromonas luteoviolacea NCIMB 1942 TaxID=1365253 RepID=A0A167GF38_9GAMM|nr:hypothetical protein [Pseudoalteromonas luteoviolacea]KZN55000.1 hypothetical protein N482_05440 [Pseudoalteromonas luteoviolacea NCIMB 1942]
MSANIDVIGSYLDQLEVYCHNGKLEDAQGEVKKMDECIKQLFANQDIELSDTQVSMLTHFYDKIGELSDLLGSQKADVSQKLGKHLSNKKKINAYKGMQ